MTKFSPKTKMIKKEYQQIIQACKQGCEYIPELKRCIADITGLEIDHVDYRAIYIWLQETCEVVEKPSFYRAAIDKIFCPSMWDKSKNCEEKVINALASELCNLNIKECDSEGSWYWLIDMTLV